MNSSYFFLPVTARIIVLLSLCLLVKKLGRCGLFNCDFRERLKEAENGINVPATSIRKRNKTLNKRMESCRLVACPSSLDEDVTITI